MSKEEVDSHDDDDFQFWNHVNIHGEPYHCSGDRQDSEDYCFSNYVNLPTESGATQAVITPRTKVTTTARDDLT